MQPSHWVVPGAVKLSPSWQKPICDCVRGKFFRTATALNHMTIYLKNNCCVSLLENTTNAHFFRVNTDRFYATLSLNKELETLFNIIYTSTYNIFGLCYNVYLT